MKPRKPQPSKQGYNWMIWVAAAIGCALAYMIPGSESAIDPLDFDLLGSSLDWIYR